MEIDHTNKVGIIYRNFYDVPRMFIVHYRGRQILFDCKFDENADEYSETFKVYLLPNLGEEVLKGTWDNLSESATRFLGEVAVKESRSIPH